MNEGLDLGPQAVCARCRTKTLAQVMLPLSFIRVPELQSSARSLTSSVPVHVSNPSQLKRQSVPMRKLQNQTSTEDVAEGGPITEQFVVLDAVKAVEELQDDRLGASLDLPYPLSQKATR